MVALRTEEALTGWPGPPTSLGSFISTAERARLPDDCTVGYIVEGLLGARLLPSTLFHSHLEDLRRLPPDAVLRQVQPSSRASPPACPPRCLALALDLRPITRAQGSVPSPAANLLHTECLACWDPGAWVQGLLWEGPAWMPQMEGDGPALGGESGGWAQTWPVWALHLPWRSCPGCPGMGGSPAVEGHGEPEAQQPLLV